MVRLDPHRVGVVVGMKGSTVGVVVGMKGSTVVCCDSDAVVSGAVEEDAVVAMSLV